MNTVLTTGASSGFGLGIAQRFHDEGWNVIATMRNPRQDVLPRSDRIRLVQLDVTDPDSIAAAIEASGPIDVLVNNAGIGVVGAFEATPMEEIRRIFETNTFGVMAMTQAVVPQFRARRSGTIVNVTSTVALLPFPMVAVYTASKTAIEGFTSSLAHELAAFDVKVKLIEPGYSPTTRFAQNLGLPLDTLIPEAYSAFAAPLFEQFANPKLVTTVDDVADAVWRAVHDESGQLQFPAGADALSLLAGRQNAAHA